MSKTPDSNSNVAGYASRPFQRFLSASFMMLRLLIIIALLIAAFPWLYEIKTKAGIDIAPGIHAGPVLEKYSHGLVKCEWLYPYYCPSHHS